MKTIPLQKRLRLAGIFFAVAVGSSAIVALLTGALRIEVGRTADTAPRQAAPVVRTVNYDSAAASTAPGVALDLRPPTQSQITVPRSSADNVIQFKSTPAPATEDVPRFSIPSIQPFEVYRNSGPATSAPAGPQLGAPPARLANVPQNDIDPSEDLLLGTSDAANIPETSAAPLQAPSAIQPSAPANLPPTNQSPSAFPKQLPAPSTAPTPTKAQPQLALPPTTQGPPITQGPPAVQVRPTAPGTLPMPQQFAVPSQAPAATNQEPPRVYPGQEYAEPGEHGFSTPNCHENAHFDERAFIPDPNYNCVPYDGNRELAGIYTGKWCVPTQAPWVELFRGLYRPGELPPASTFLTGEKNPIIPHFLVFGDFRSAIAVNDNGGDDEFAVLANRLNLDFDLKITSTERIHAFWGPLDEDGRFTRAEMRDDDIELIEEFDDDFDTLFFEGDLGYIWGGMTDQYAPFDLPFVAGKYPLLFQNGTWMLDAIEGFAFTLPGKNSRILDWSNYEVTFFFGFDDVDSPAFRGNDNAADLFGVTTFIEAYDGYLELGYAFLDDRTGQGLSYHNIGVSFTRRYFQRVSSSFRVIVNTGQDPVAGEQTADGQLVLWENALVSNNPNYFVPYFNMFAGFDRPQAVALAAGGVLLNTGINFETDGLTGYPRLDDTANDTWGGAIGMNILGPDFSWQLITEFAMVQTFGNGGQRLNAVDDQYAFGARFQVPLTNAWLARIDGMYAIRENDDNLNGARFELRWKF